MGPTVQAGLLDFFVSTYGNSGDTHAHHRRTYVIVTSRCPSLWRHSILRTFHSELLSLRLELPVCILKLKIMDRGLLWALNMFCSHLHDNSFLNAYLEREKETRCLKHGKTVSFSKRRNDITNITFCVEMKGGRKSCGKWEVSPKRERQRERERERERGGDRVKSSYE